MNLDRKEFRKQVNVQETRFIFVSCQRGAEKACKSELERSHPELRFAFSRPGFLTFKLDGNWPDCFVLKSTFARTYGWSIGKVVGTESQAMVLEVLSIVKELPFRQVHVWQRDSSVPGTRGFEPFPTELALTIGQLICDELKREKTISIEPNRPAKSNQKILDVILVEPDQWWIGWHVGGNIAARWVGGVPPLQRDEELISRAYYKLAEAALWSQLPVRGGDLVVEIGSAPGGATEFLLEMGATVFAIDPAEMDPSLVDHPKLMHLKMRGKDVPKKDMKGARWLVADLNVAPNYTLDTVEEFVTNQHLRFRGMVLTLKLTDWELAGELDACRERVKKWGFGVVKTRQLAFNRQEVCLVAMKDRIDVRGQKKKMPRKRPTP